MTVAHFTRGGSLPLSPRKRDSLNADTSRGQSVIETKSERSRYESPSVRLAAERLRAAPLAEPESEEILERSEQMTRGDPKSEHYRAVREVFTVPTSFLSSMSFLSKRFPPKPKVKPRHISYFESLVTIQSCFLSFCSDFHMIS